MKKFKLSEKKEQWVGKRDVNLQGIPLHYNISDQIDYYKDIKKLTDKMTEEVKRRITLLFSSNLSDDFFHNQKEIVAMDNSLSDKAKKLMNDLTFRFQKLFNDKAKKISEKMVNTAASTSSVNLKNSLEYLSGGLALKTDFIPHPLKNIVKASINENVSLIKSIPQKYLSDISGSVMRSITTGNGLKDLIPAISKHSNQTKRRIKNLALDQTRKAYNVINKQRLISIGVKKFKWLHSGGGQHPRKSHIAMNGKVFSYDDLPIINKEQADKGYESPQKGIPGQAINCGCTMNPVVSFE